MDLNLFLAKVNKVTAYHRHGNAIPREALDDLSNAQIDMEKELCTSAAQSGTDYERAYKRANEIMKDGKIVSLGLDESDWGTVRDRIADALVEGATQPAETVEPCANCMGKQLEYYQRRMKWQNCPWCGRELVVPEEGA